jgi:hypothetical protein
VPSCMASRLPTILCGAKSREGPPHHLSRVHMAMAMAMAMATVLRRQRIGVLRRDGADDCWQSPPSKIAQQKMPLFAVRSKRITRLGQD